MTHCTFSEHSITELRFASFLFNAALNKFYLRLFDVRHIKNDHSASEESHCHHFMGYSPTDRTVHTMAFVTPVVE